MSIVGKALDEIRDETEGLEEEISRLENKITDLENELEQADAHNDRLLGDVTELQEYVQELETALAESYLMSADDGPELECDPTKSSSTSGAST